MVDSGSFGIFVNGNRVATEKFSVRQGSDGVSSASSELMEQGSTNPAQRSELKIMPSGALVQYDWHELSPGKSELVVLPNNEFLIEKVTENPGEKPKEQPFVLPNTSVILDNNFFIQREVLIWRYLSSSCVSEAGKMKCAPAQFGAVIPQDRLSVRVGVEPVGQEKVAIRGVERQLLRLNLKTEDGDWALWADPDDHYKLIRVQKSGENTEIVRD